MTTSTGETWKALRQASGLSQRKAEERLNWKHGYLSWIERGVTPTPEQEAQLRALYAGILLDDKR